MRRSLSFKFPYGGKQNPPAGSGKPRVVLITGASSGIGKSLAEKLLKKGGSSVYCAARNVDAMESLKAEGGKIQKMDVTDESSVNGVTRTVINEQGNIDVLVCNAGYACFGAVETVDLETLQKQFEVNVFGVARCLRAVLPYMREKRSGRIVLVSSVVSHVSMAGIGWYAATKHALHAMAVALRQEVKPFGIDVVLVEPGPIKTGFSDAAFSQLDSLNAPEDYVSFHRNLKKYFTGVYSNAPGPDSTTNQILSAVCDKKPKYVYKTAKEAKVLPFVASFTSDGMYDSYCKSMITRAASAPERPAGSAPGESTQKPNASEGPTDASSPAVESPASREAITLAPVQAGTIISSPISESPIQAAAPAAEA